MNVFDISQGNYGQGDDVKEFRECRVLIRGFTGTTYVTLCVCDRDNCNAGHNIQPKTFVAIIGAIFSVLISRVLNNI